MSKPENMKNRTFLTSRRSHLGLLSILLATLTACGGGSSSDSSCITPVALPACATPTNSLYSINAIQGTTDTATQALSGSVSTLNQTLRRKASITRGSVPASGWNVADQWYTFPIDTFSGLGSR